MNPVICYLSTFDGYLKMENTQALAKEVEPLIDLFDESAEPSLLEPAQLKIIKRLWTDEGVEKCYDRRREYQVLCFLIFSGHVPS